MSTGASVGSAGWQVHSAFFLPHCGQSPAQSGLQSSTVGIWNMNSYGIGDESIHVWTNGFHAALHCRDGITLVDFSGVTFMDSSGIAVALRGWQRMRELGGAVTLYHVAQQPRKVFEASGVGRMVTIV